MTKLQIIFFPICIGVLFAEFSEVPQKFSRWLLRKYKKGKAISLVAGEWVKVPYRLKPFDCGMCLALWIAITQNIVLNLHPYEIIGYACTSSIIAYLLIRIHERIIR